MRIVASLCLGLFLQAIPSQSAQISPPPFEWATRLEGTGTSGWSITAQSTGSPLVAGETEGSLQLGTTNLVKVGDSMGFLVLMNPEGEPTGGVGLTGPGNASVLDVTSHSDTQAIAGSFETDEINFGGESHTSSGMRDGFVASYDLSQQLNWVVTAEAAGDCYCRSLATTAQGDLVVLGGFNGSTMTVGNHTLTNATDSFGYDLFVAKILSNGTVEWARSLGGSDAEYPEGLAIGVDGAIYIVGAFQSSDFEVGDTLLSAHPGQTHAYIVKLDSVGNPVWARSHSSTEWNHFNSVGVDPVSNDVVATGTLEPTGNNRRMIAMRFTASGDVVWKFESKSMDFDSGWDIALDANGNSIIGGSSGYGATVWKLDWNGNVIWKKYSAQGVPGMESIYGVAVSPDQSILLLFQFDSEQLRLDEIQIPRIDGEPWQPTSVVAKLAADPPAIRHQPIGNQLHLSWPTNQTEFQIESSSLPWSSQDWETLPFVEEAGRNTASPAMDQPGQVFRLRMDSSR